MIKREHIKQAIDAISAESRAWQSATSVMARTNQNGIGAGDPATLVLTGGLSGTQADSYSRHWALNLARTIYGQANQGLQLKINAGQVLLDKTITGSAIVVATRVNNGSLTYQPAITITGQTLVLRASIEAGARQDDTLSVPNIDHYTPSEIDVYQGQYLEMNPTSTGGLPTAWTMLDNPWDDIQPPTYPTINAGGLLPTTLPNLTFTYAFNPADYPAGYFGQAVLEIRQDRYINLVTGVQSNVSQYNETPAPCFVAAALYKANQQWVAQGKTGTVVVRVHGNLSKTIEYVQIGGGDAGQKNFRVS